MSLSVKHGTVCLLKTAKTDVQKRDPYLEHLESSGYKGLCIPVLRFEFVNQEELMCCLQEPDYFSSVIFTSQRAVEAVQKCVEHMTQQDWFNDLQMLWAAKKCFVVGSATSEAARRLGFTPQGEKSGSAEQLVPIILQELQAENKPVLFPAGNLKRETIPQALKQNNIPVKAITAYETLPDRSIKESLQSVLREQEGVPEYIVFFSPSGVNSTCDILKELGMIRSEVKLVAIGRTTQAALQQACLPVAETCEKPSPQCLVAALNSLTGENS